MKERTFITDSEDPTSNRQLKWPQSEDEAFSVFLDEDSDSPTDCHNHCRCWDSVGECCECGDVRTPNHEYKAPKEMANDEIFDWKQR